MIPHRILPLLPYFLLAAVSILLAGCTSSDEAPQNQRVVLSNVHAEGYPTARGLQDFATRVAADPHLGTTLVMDLQLGGVLGNEKETLEKLSFGAVQMACTSVAPLAEFSQTIGVLTLPYLFRDPAHLWAVLEGPIGDELLASLQDSGFVGLAWYDAGARSFYNRKRPIRRLEDLAGLKIRVQKSEIMREMVEALGGSPVSLGFKEVYTNLYTGSLDGAENNLPSFRSERHFEVARFYSTDRHSMIPDVLLIHLGLWNRLSKDQQQALRQAARESATTQRALWSKTVEEALVVVRDAGVEVNEIEGGTGAFQQAVAPLYERHGKGFGDLVERIRAVGQSPPTVAPEPAISTSK